MDPATLLKLKYQFADFLLGTALVALGGVVGVCKEIAQLDTTGSAGPLVDSANSVFNVARDFRARVQTKITSYDIAA